MGDVEDGLIDEPNDVNGAFPHEEATPVKDDGANGKKAADCQSPGSNSRSRNRSPGPTDRKRDNLYPIRSMDFWESLRGSSGTPFNARKNEDRPKKPSRFSDKPFSFRTDLDDPRTKNHFDEKENQLSNNCFRALENSRDADDRSVPRTEQATRDRRRSRERSMEPRRSPDRRRYRSPERRKSRSRDRRRSPDRRPSDRKENSRYDHDRKYELNRKFRMDSDNHQPSFNFNPDRRAIDDSDLQFKYDNGIPRSKMSPDRRLASQKPVREVQRTSFDRQLSEKSGSYRDTEKSFDARPREEETYPLHHYSESPPPRLCSNFSRNTSRCYPNPRPEKRDEGDLWSDHGKPSTTSDGKTAEKNPWKISFSIKKDKLKQLNSSENPLWEGKDEEVEEDGFNIPAVRSSFSHHRAQDTSIDGRNVNESQGYQAANLAWSSYSHQKHDRKRSNDEPEKRRTRELSSGLVRDSSPKRSRQDTCVISKFDYEYNNNNNSTSSYYGSSSGLLREMEPSEARAESPPGLSLNEMPQDKDERVTQSNGLCKYYLCGFCKLGNGCSFSHDAQPLVQKKLELCSYYAESMCNRGDLCHYLHKQFPCRYYHRGNTCNYENRCKFSHEKMTRELEEALDLYLSLPKPLKQPQSTPSPSGGPSNAYRSKSDSGFGMAPAGPPVPPPTLTPPCPTFQSTPISQFLPTPNAQFPPSSNPHLSSSSNSRFPTGMFPIPPATRPPAGFPPGGKLPPPGFFNPQMMPFPTPFGMAPMFPPSSMQPMLNMSSLPFGFSGPPPNSNCNLLPDFEKAQNRLPSEENLNQKSSSTKHDNPTSSSAVHSKPQQTKLLIGQKQTQSASDETKMLTPSPVTRDPRLRGDSSHEVVKYEQEHMSPRQRPNNVLNQQETAKHTPVPRSIVTDTMTIPLAPAEKMKDPRIKQQ